MSIYTAPDLDPRHRIEAVEVFLASFAPDNTLRFDFTEAPKTDGKTVALGQLDPSDPQFEIFAVGHGIHEMLHVTDTDMKAVDHDPDALEHSLLNVLEDIRIDTLGARRYPSYQSYRNELIDALKQRGQLRFAVNPEPLSRAEHFFSWVHTALLVDLGLTWAAPYHDNFSSYVARFLTSEQRATTLATARRVHAADDTRACVDIVREMLTADIRELLTLPATASQAASSGVGVTRFGLHIPTLIDLATCASADIAGKGNGYCDQPTAAIRSMEWVERCDDKFMRDDQIRYAKLFDLQRHRLDDLTDQFTEILKYPDWDESEHAPDGVALADDFISVLSARSQRVFTAQNERDTPRADICILLDRSGSMGNERVTMAKLGVAALLKSLESVNGVRTQVAAFPGLNRIPIGVVKTFEMSAHEADARLASVNAYGGTPLSAALDWAQQTLPVRDAHRLVIMLTDGVFPSDKLLPAAKAFKENGIELALLCIDTRIDGLCENTVNVDAPDEIVPALIRLVSQTSLAKHL